MGWFSDSDDERRERRIAEIRDEVRGGKTEAWFDSTEDAAVRKQLAREEKISQEVDRGKTSAWTDSDQDRKTRERMARNREIAQEVDRGKTSAWTDNDQDRKTRERMARNREIAQEVDRGKTSAWTDSADDARIRKSMSLGTYRQEDDIVRPKRRRTGRAERNNTPSRNASSKASSTDRTGESSGLKRLIIGIGLGGLFGWPPC